MYFFIILFITFFLNNILGSDSKSLPKQVFFPEPGSSSKNRTQSLSPKRQIPQNLCILSYSDNDDRFGRGRGKEKNKNHRKPTSLSPKKIDNTHTKPRSKTDPEINSDDLPNKSLSKSPREKGLDDRFARGKEPRNGKPHHHTSCSPRPMSPHKDELNPFVIFRNKMSNFDELCHFLQNHEKNPNIQDIGTHQTAFHYAVLWKNEILVDLFLSHPGLNSLLANKKGIIAYQYLTETETEKYKSLYNKLQLRATLDQIIYALLITDKEFFNKKLLLSDCFCKIDKLFSRIPKEIIPSYANVQFILAMIKSQRKYYRQTLETIREEYKRDLNHQDECGNTLLHHAVFLRDSEIVSQLLQNPNIACQKRNKNHLLPQDLLSNMKKNENEIRAILSMRYNLECQTREAITALTTHSPTDNLILTNVITTIKEKYEQDSQLPSPASQLPAYATNDFFFQLIKYELNQRKPSNQQIVCNASLI